jgi:hypothetical protein
MTVSSQNVGKLHHYKDPQFNTEFDRIYDFLANAKFPDNTVNGRKLLNGSVPETKLIGPLSADVAPGAAQTPHRTDAEIDTLIEASVPYRVQSYAHVQDQKPSGVNAGTFSAGAFRTRDLNTIVEDDDSIISLAINQITLEDGEYYIRAAPPAASVGAHTSRWQNITDAVTTLEGTSARMQPLATTYSTSISFIRGHFTVTGGPKAFEVQHRCGFGVALAGFGFNTAFNSVEIYTTVELWKIER